MAIVEGFATGVATGLGHECVKRHADDIAEFAAATIETMETAVEEGWKKDYEAGGISSWNSQAEPEPA